MIYLIQVLAVVHSGKGYLFSVLVLKLQVSMYLEVANEEKGKYILLIAKHNQIRSELSSHELHNGKVTQSKSRRQGEKRFVSSGRL